MQAKSVFHPAKWLVAVWFCGVVLGMGILTNFSSAPGVIATAASVWPATATWERAANRPSLVMFVHPRCPCSTASLNELARLSANYRERMDFSVLFVAPPGSPADFHQTALWDSAIAIPGLRVVADGNGELAVKFGATTSGHCFVYDSCGKLLFDGGITAGRGHEGDNPGQEIIRSVAAGRMTAQSSHCATFGCPLFSRRAQPPTQSRLCDSVQVR